METLKATTKATEVTSQKLMQEILAKTAQQE